MFEQELYQNFSISSSRSYFISFAGDVSAQNRGLLGLLVAGLMCLLGSRCVC